MLPLFTEETMSKYLTAAEVLPFLHGCCGTYMLDGYTCFSRFTAEELAYYGDRSGTDFVRSHAPSGIRLDFITDAPEISFTYLLYRDKGFYILHSGFDIWEDGVFGANYRIDPGVTDEITVSYTRKKTEPSRIQIHFTNGSVVLMDKFCLGNAVPVEKKEKSILFYGDSLTQSAYIPTPSLSWAHTMAEHMDAEALNRGIGSMIFEAPSLPSAPDCVPDMIFIEYGCNDLGKTPDNETGLALADAWMKKICKLYPTAEKFCIPPDFSPRGDCSDAYWNRMEPYCTGLAEISRLYGIHVIPGKILIPDLPDLFFEDLTHFNEAGSAIFAGNLQYAVGRIRRGETL